MFGLCGFRAGRDRSKHPVGLLNDAFGAAKLGKQAVVLFGSQTMGGHQCGWLNTITDTAGGGDVTDRSTLPADVMSSA